MFRARREQSLGQALQRIRQQYGTAALDRLGSSPCEPASTAISTGSLALDLALGSGGIPRGRISEIFGSEGSGKTTVGLHLLASAQRDAGLAGFIDAEHSFDPTYARQVGVRLPDLVVAQPDDGEQAFEILAELVASNALDAIVIDSVAALVPRAELEGGLGVSDPMLQARMMSRELRRLAGAIGRSHTALVFLNQMRSRLATFGPRETTPGGRALRFLATIRIHLDICGSLSDRGICYGQRVRARVVKNKLAEPFQSAQFDLLFGQGIPWAGEVLALAEQFELVQNREGCFLRGDAYLGRDRAAAVRFLQDNPDLQFELEQLVLEAVAAD